MSDLINQWLEAYKQKDQASGYEIQNNFTEEDYKWFLKHPEYINSLNLNADNLYWVSEDGETAMPTQLHEDLYKAFEQEERKHIDSNRPKFQPFPVIAKSNSSSTLEHKYQQLAELVSSLGVDIRRVRDTETVEGAEAYAAKMNKEHPGQYQVESRDIDGDDIPEVMINKKYYNPFTKTYSDHKPYIVNGWKLSRKDVLKPIYQRSVQSDLGYGHQRTIERRKWKKTHTDDEGNELPYPDFNTWKTDVLYTREDFDEKDPKYTPFAYKSVDRGNVLTPEQYDALEKVRAPPRETKTAKGVFVKALSDLTNRHFGDNVARRKAFYDENGGFIQLASNVYKNFVSGPMERELIKHFNIDLDDEKTLKKYKARGEYKDQIKEVVEYYLTPDGQNEILGVLFQQN